MSKELLLWFDIFRGQEGRSSRRAFQEDYNGSGGREGGSGDPHPGGHGGRGVGGRGGYHNQQQSTGDSKFESNVCAFLFLFRNEHLFILICGADPFKQSLHNNRPLVLRTLHFILRPQPDVENVSGRDWAGSESGGQNFGSGNSGVRK